MVCILATLISAGRSGQGAGCIRVNHHHVAGSLRKRGVRDQKR